MKKIIATLIAGATIASASQTTIDATMSLLKSSSVLHKY